MAARRQIANRDLFDLVPAVANDHLPDAPEAIDLFAGAGGFTEGARIAGIKVVWAGNHWTIAVETHAHNHPEAQHVCQDLQQADWRLVPRHDILLASPACQGHSPAKGKEKPHHDATRSTAWAVISALEFHRPAAAVIENVKAFMNWTLYPAWLQAAHALGYAIAPHLLDAAEHGVPQERVRVILVLTRSKHPLQLQLERKPLIPVSTVLDFNAGSWSPIEKKGRAPATLARIAQGRADGLGDQFVIPYYGSGSGLTGRTLTRPIGTITTRDRWALIDGDRMRMMSTPEAKACQGFRPDYILPDDGKLAMHMIGNAVPPPMVADVLTALQRQF